MKNSFSELTLDEMIVKREEIRKKLHELRAKLTLGQVNNPVEIRILKRQIARLNTRIYNYEGEIKE